MSEPKPAPKPKSKRSLRLALVVIVLLAVAVVAALWIYRHFSRSEPVWLQGQIEATEVRVAAKVGGRVASVEVQRGQTVDKDQLLVVLDLPEVRARGRQVQAQVEAAQAMADKAESGAREEQIRAARAQWQAAEQQAEFASVSAERIERLHADGVVPAQRRDEAVAKAAAARGQAEAARQAWEIARDATRPEDRRAAMAQLSQAQSGLDEVQVTLDEAEQRAPAAGEISVTVVEPGEVVGPGSPLVVISRSDDPWLTLNLREDLLSAVQMGSELTGQLPALGRREVTFRVDYMAPLADFATWRSARDLGGFDLRTFEIRARPTALVEGLRPGMTVLIDERSLQ
ncbi:HlyD family secretion protein [Wenzhouxiangella limi]|uniref:HlyD family efflux transporter periplasmic adaptor subunit n=1 Tax=Wenzhouxiangella limi TaxID=2707351 RepID=A0A845V196_9GAMM|nr:efflux RND transporter periplasmic adaptor subunit [Wenzhouxiangella limi]NDY95990.1 HlyD family efflux transporter periplasmic adaptor subunit [Wenzhouxiangella limi]